MALFPFAGVLNFFTGGNKVVNMDADGLELPLAGTRLKFPDGTTQTTSGSGVPSTAPSGGYTVTNVYLDSNKVLRVDYDTTPVT